MVTENWDCVGAIDVVSKSGMMGEESDSHEFSCDSRARGCLLKDGI